MSGPEETRPASIFPARQRFETRFATVFGQKIPFSGKNQHSETSALSQLDFGISRVGAGHGSAAKTGANAQTANVSHPISNKR